MPRERTPEVSAFNIASACCASKLVRAAVLDRNHTGQISYRPTARGRKLSHKATSCKGSRTLFCRGKFTFEFDLLQARGLSTCTSDPSLIPHKTATPISYAPLSTAFQRTKIT